MICFLFSDLQEKVKIFLKKCIFLRKKVHKREFICYNREKVYERMRKCR